MDGKNPFYFSNFKMNNPCVLDKNCLIVLLRSDLDEIHRICSTCPCFQKLICANESFWYSKFKRDYPVLAKLPAFEFLPEIFDNWKQVLIHLRDVQVSYQLLFSDFLKLQISNPDHLPTLNFTDKQLSESFLKITQHSTVFTLEFQLNLSVDKQVDQKINFTTIDRLRDWLPNIIDQINQINVQEITLQNNDQIISQMRF